MDNVRAAQSETTRRMSKAIGKSVAVDVDYPSFASHASPTLASVLLIEHAFDRVAGAVEWFCDWPSCQRQLGEQLEAVRIEHSEDGNVVVFDGGVLTIGNAFVSDVTLPQANSLAHVLDEHCQLYKGRVEDVRLAVMPQYEDRLREILGNEVNLRLNVENFGRLDWEEDSFYNGYSELAPSNAEAFFGRLVAAVQHCCHDARDLKKCRDGLQVIEIKLSLKPEKRISFKNRTLKLCERFWNGIEHDSSDIKDCLSSALHLGFDVNVLVDEIASEYVPYWTERIRRLLGCTVPIRIDWPSFRNSPSFVAAVETMHHRRSAWVLERVWGAIQDCVDLRGQAAVDSIAAGLAAVHVRVCRPHDARCDCTPADSGVVARADGQLCAPTRWTLNVQAAFGQGVVACASQDHIGDVLQGAFNIKPSVTDDKFQVTGLNMSASGVQLTGNMTSMGMFNQVFDMLEDYADRRRSPAPAALPHPGPPQRQQLMPAPPAAQQQQQQQQQQQPVQQQQQQPVQYQQQRLGPQPAFAPAQHVVQLAPRHSATQGPFYNHPVQPRLVAPPGSRMMSHPRW